jgi:hypothetical protein
MGLYQAETPETDAPGENSELFFSLQEILAFCAGLRLVASVRRSNRNHRETTDFDEAVVCFVLCIRHQQVTMAPIRKRICRRR